jgi:hypothetical protein
MPGEAVEAGDEVELDHHSKPDPRLDPTDCIPTGPRQWQQTTIRHMWLLFLHSIFDSYSPLSALMKRRPNGN